MTGSDTDKIVVVTGASRGAGKGIALALAPGATVYITGRTQVEGTNAENLPGTVYETARAVEIRGGVAVPVICDHSDDDQVKALFDRISEESGHIDILVNNAISLPSLPDSSANGFWELSLADELRLLDVGFRSHYVAAHYAAPLMISQGKGLIAHISSPGATTYIPGMHGPTYGAGKAGSDKMVFDMSHDLRRFGVAAVSLWPGLLNTERVAANSDNDPGRMDGQFPSMESPEFIGRVIDALWKDPHVLDKSGRTFYGSELGTEYDVTDVDGTVPASYRGWLGPPSKHTEVVSTWSEYATGTATVPSP